MKLKIGPFTNEVLCDIMPMDYCHILLGRPWQFHRHFVYGGRVNKYTTRKDGVTYALLPLIQTSNEMSCTVKVFMFNGKEFEKDMKRNLIWFYIIPRGPKCTSGDWVIEASVHWVTNSDDWVLVEI